MVYVTNPKKRNSQGIHSQPLHVNFIQKEEKLQFSKKTPSLSNRSRVENRTKCRYTTTFHVILDFIRHIRIRDDNHRLGLVFRIRTIRNRREIRFFLGLQRFVLLAVDDNGVGVCSLHLVENLLAVRLEWVASGPDETAFDRVSGNLGTDQIGYDRGDARSCGDDDDFAEKLNDARHAGGGNAASPVAGARISNVVRGPIAGVGDDDGKGFFVAAGDCRKGVPFEKGTCGDFQSLGRGDRSVGEMHANGMRGKTLRPSGDSSQACPW